MSDNDQMVQGGELGSVTEQKPVTPTEQGVAPVATPAQLPQDAEVSRLKTEYDAKVKKYEDDIRNIKSTFQKQVSQSEQIWKERQRQWKEEMENIRLSGMDDEQRKQYENKRASVRLQELEQQLSQTEEEKQNAQAMLNAHNYFLSKGVPANVLVTDQGYDTLWNSGMDWISERLAQLNAPAPTSIAAPVQPKVPPTAPPVDTGTGTPPAGPTWEDLRRQYGSDERVYELIEQRRLSPDILPKPR